MRIHLVRTVAAVLASALLAAACTTAAPGDAPPGTPSAAAPTAAAPVPAAPDVPPGGIDPATRFTPLTAATLTTPQPVIGTDGRTHLAYELVLTNLTGTTVRLDELEVLDAASRQPLLSLAGPQLAASSNPVGSPPGEEGADAAAETSIPSSGTAIVWLDVALTGPPPAALVHRTVSSILPPGGPPVPVDATSGEIAVDPAPAVVLGPPLDGGEWYASDGCCADDTHHRRGLAPVDGQMLVAQRFAIDWYLLDDQHRTWWATRA